MKKMPALLGALALAQILAAAQANPLQEELLEAKEAFALTLKAKDANTLEAQWKVADGYYLYRDKFKFESLDTGVTLLPAVMPAGIKKHDEFFGEVETFRKTIRIKLPLNRLSNEADNVKLRITAQGCADIGVCYPPLIQEVSVSLAAFKNAPTTPAPASPALPEKSIKSLATLGNLIEPAGEQQEFLRVDQAFELSAATQDSNTLIARLRIAPGYYLYRDKTRFELTGADNTRLEAYELPKGQIKIDPYIGKTEIYHDQVEIKLPLSRDASVPALFTLKASYQGCAEKGICYPPVSKAIHIALPAGEAKNLIFTPAADTAEVPAEPAPTDASDLWGFLAAVAGAFGVGLLLTFTPCVLPMIPILSSIIVGQAGTKITKLKGGMLSLSYVMGTAVTYTAAGVLAGATGGQLQAYFQNPYAIGVVSGIFVLLSLSMFGFYALQMPSFIQSRVTQKTQGMQGGGLVSTFVLGLLSSLIVGACVSPLIIGVLGVAIKQADPALGGALMFSMAMGMGVILIAIGVGAGFLLPKAGAWMDKVKYVFGVLLLAVAIYLLTALPQVPVLLLWAALLIVSAVYLGATQSLPDNASNWRTLWKGVGTLLLIWGVLALLGGLAGERDITHPLPRTLFTHTGATSTVTAETSAESAELFTRYATVEEVDAALAAARAAGKPAILDYYATWCLDCVRMEKATMSDPRVRSALKRYALIQADVTQTNATTQAIKSRFKVLGPPAVLFFDADGRERTDLHFYGYRNAEDFLAILEKI
jgi:thiol:disulfide interchange protein DsbD